MEVGGPVVGQDQAPGIWMPAGYDAEQVHRLAFVPVCGGQDRGQRLVFGPLGGDMRAQNAEFRPPRQTEYMVEPEAPMHLALVDRGRR
jgi:hypothetical protein